MTAAATPRDASGAGGAFPASYWLATGNPHAEADALVGAVDTEVVIIGAGFTGLSCAYYLQRAGIGSVVVEAQDVGWGASGRNGGMLPPRYKKGFAALAKKYGNEVTLRLHRLVHEAIDTVEATVDDCEIDCDFHRSGQLTAAHSREHLRALEADRDWMAAVARDDAARILDRHAMMDEVGGGTHVGGWLDPRGAGIHPLNYTRGLARALRARGVRICTHSPVLRLVDDATGVRVETARGSVRARQAIIATNAYTDMVDFAPGRLDRRIVAVNSSVVATMPLSANVAAAVLPTRRMVADTKHIMNWYRIMPDNCVIFGGRGDITGRSDDPGVYAMLERQIVEHFPQLEGVGIGQRWSGKVAVTLDDFPHIGRLSPQVAFAMGYGGRGVALSNLLGKLLARLVRNEAVDAGPMSSNRFAPVPFHALRIPGMQIVASWYRYLDAKALRSEGKGK